MFMNALTRIGKYTVPALLAGGLMLPTAATADKVADFYKGKRLSMYVGFSQGGGYDTYARVLAAHMGRHIPGKPSFVTRNLTGAGSMRLVNQLYNVMKKDGTNVATFGRGIPANQVFGEKGVQYDARKINWLGSLNSEVSVCVAWHTVPVNTVGDLKTRGLIVGGTGPSGDTDVFPKVMNNIVGTKMKLVTGYPGGNDINFAMERKELEGRCGWSWSSVVSTRPQWIKDKKIKLLVQMATEKHPALPNVPFVMDLAKSKKDKQILELIYGRQDYGRPFATTPGVPKARVAALRKAFVATGKDPKFTAEAKKRNLPLLIMDGEKLQKKIVALFDIPKDLIAEANKAQKYDGNIQITKAKIPTEVKKDFKVSTTKRGGRSITFVLGSKKQKVSVSGSRTKVTIAGKKAKRKAITVGMVCTLKHKGSKALAIDCK